MTHSTRPRTARLQALYQTTHSKVTSTLPHHTQQDDALDQTTHSKVTNNLPDHGTSQSDKHSACAGTRHEAISGVSDNHRHTHYPRVQAGRVDAEHNLVLPYPTTASTNTRQCSHPRVKLPGSWEWVDCLENRPCSGTANHGANLADRLPWGIGCGVNAGLV